MSLLLSLAIAAGVLSAASDIPTETLVEAPGPSGPLKGTMLSPPDPGGPVTLIIPGSGPTDRDGNSSMGVKAGTYRLLAEGLAQRGIASVRIDKRGMFGSAGAVADPNAVTIPDYVADVHSWVGSISAKTGVPCIWLLGHSEGALVALAAGNFKEVCGLVLVAAPGRPLGDVLREQLKANPANAPMLDHALAAIDSLENGNPINTADMHPALLALFAPQIQKFMISLLSYDPAEMLGRYDKPVLILHGERDIQVGEEDAGRLKEASPRATLVILPDTNHVLKVVKSEDRAANIAAYGDPELPLAPGVTEAIADFLLAKAKPR